MSPSKKEWMQSADKLNNQVKWKEWPPSVTGVSVKTLHVAVDTPLSCQDQPETISEEIITPAAKLIAFQRDLKAQIICAVNPYLLSVYYVLYKKWQI